jgi:hypothetical protein
MFDEVHKIERSNVSIVVNVPRPILLALQETPQRFGTEARIALAAKFFEMKRLACGQSVYLR